jgi:ribosomal protein S27AE
MSKNRKMTCPDCGVLMNHHASKIDYTASLDDPEAIDTDLGGIVEEAHTCPACGRTRLRRQDAATVNE